MIQQNNISWNRGDAGKKTARRAVFFIAAFLLLLSAPVSKPAYAQEDVPNPLASGQFGDYLLEWWEKDFYPALKDMTKQLNTSRIDQTRQLGQMFDAQAVADITSAKKEENLRNRKDNTPSELTCVPRSNLAALQQAADNARNLTEALKLEIMKTTYLTGDSRFDSDIPVETGDSGISFVKNAFAQTTPTKFPTGKAAAWAEYCYEFQDPLSNNGVSGCKEPERPGNIVNGDINVENLLLKDSISMTEPAQHKAMLAVMRNLVKPQTDEKIAENAVKTVSGEQEILKRQHLESVRNISADAIASIAARRAAIPNLMVNFTAPVVATGEGPYNGMCRGPYRGPNSCKQVKQGKKWVYDWVSCGSYEAAVRASENSGNYGGKPNSIGCVGAYQFCKGSRLYCRDDFSGPGCGGSVQGFLNCPTCQDNLHAAFDADKWKQAKRLGLMRYLNTTGSSKPRNVSFMITASGLSGTMHLGGAGSAQRLLKYGSDANDGTTYVSQYMQRFGGFEVCPGCDLPPGVKACGEATTTTTNTQNGTKNDGDIIIVPLKPGEVAGRSSFTEEAQSQNRNNQNQSGYVGSACLPIFTTASKSLNYAHSRCGAGGYSNASGMTYCGRFTREATGIGASSAMCAFAIQFRDNPGKVGPPDISRVQPGDALYWLSHTKNGGAGDRKCPIQTWQGKPMNNGHTAIYSGRGNNIGVTKGGIIRERPMNSFGPPRYEWQGFVSTNGGGGGYIPPDAVPPTPPVPAGELVKKIRLKAGVPESEISENPSYNEIMQAMTKERFYDPAYFIQIKDQPGTIMQEQNSLNTFTNMQYQDIYRLQEQINALLAARASLKFNSDIKPNGVNAAPVK